MKVEESKEKVIKVQFLLDTILWDGRKENCHCLVHFRTGSQSDQYSYTGQSCNSVVWTAWKMFSTPVKLA